jgi:hypothetical protein
MTHIEKGSRQNERINTIIESGWKGDGNAVLEAIENQLSHKSTKQKRKILSQWGKAVKLLQNNIDKADPNFVDEVSDTVHGLTRELKRQRTRGGSGRRRKTKKHTRKIKNRSRARKNRSQHRN